MLENDEAVQKLSVLHYLVKHIECFHLAHPYKTITVMFICKYKLCLGCDTMQSNRQTNLPTPPSHHIFHTQYMYIFYLLMTVSSEIYSYVGLPNTNDP